MQSERAKSIPVTVMTRLAVLILAMSVVCGLAATSALAQSWEFGTSSLEGWSAAQGVSNLHTSIGSLVGDVTGLDPYLIGPSTPVINASTSHYVQIRMKTNAGSRAEFFWKTAADSNFKPGREVAFALNADNQFHVYTIDMSANSEWTGSVNTLRLDPSDLANGHFVIDYIRVVSSAPAVLEASTPSAATRFAFVGEQVTVSVTVRNKGYAPATGVQATLTAPGQTVLTTQPVTAGTIPAGGQAMLQWQLSCVSAQVTTLSATIVASDPVVTIPKSSFLVVTVSRPSLSSQSPDRAQAWKDAGGNAVIENSKVRMAFYNSPFGYGVGELYVRNAGAWDLAAATSPLSCLGYRRSTGTDSAVALVPSLASVVPVSSGARLTLSFACSDIDGGQWQGSMTYDLADDTDLVTAKFTLSCTLQRNLLYWNGPSLCAGNRCFGSVKSQALFPGLEWLTGSEQSSNTLESAPGFDLRVTPHPYKVTLPLMAVSGGGKLVALLWDPLQKWDGTNTCPSPCFCSPNWFEGQDNHLMELLVPTVPRWLSENTTSAFSPYALQANAQLALECRYLTRVGAEVLDAAQQWYTTFGVPAMPGGNGLLESALLAARSGLMNTLWDSTSKGWPDSVGSAPSSYPELSQDLIADLLTEPNASTKADLRARADEAVQNRILLSGAMGLGSGSGSHTPDYRLPYFAGHLDELATRMQSDTASLISTQQADGGWFVKVDSSHPELTAPGTKELGSCAQYAYQLLRYARVSGASASQGAGIRALNYMNGFTIPRAAQVWEVPQHAPDILAAAWACGAYLEGYLLTGDSGYLDKARYWGKAGLPFVYSWRAPDRSTMDYASVPVFGCTFFTIPWYGLPVQWCGMVHAYFLNRLGDSDSSMPWKTIAEGLTRSGIQQMAASPYPGAYPDSFNVLYSNTPNPVYINPDTIYKCAATLLGRFSDVNVKVMTGPGKIVRISTGARVVLSCFNAAGNQLVMKLQYPVSETAHVLVFGAGSPTAVYKGSVALAYSDDADLSAEGWSYDSAQGCVVIKVVQDSPEQTISLLTGGSLTPLVQLDGPAGAKALSNGALVIVAGVVTACFPRVVYVQSEASGIKAFLASSSAIPVQIGDSAEVVGYLATLAGERYLANADVRRLP